MITVAGYNVREIISQDEHITICRGHREKDQKPVILKVLNKEYPKPEEISRIKFEYEISKNLDIKGTPDPLGLEKHKNGLALVMEDVGGKSVKAWIEDQKISEADFLPVSIQLTEILGEIHQQNIIHKDIKPSNLIVNTEDGYVGVIDFGIASHLSREKQKIVTPDVLEGTLAYISPEQTGRMNRSVDYRSDFYSLGVSFYEMLRGRLPFPAEDSMELVHCHIAKTPEPLHMTDKAIPKVISDIVMKLMSKNAEDRYQSAYGLKADLETCLRQWQENGKIETFEIAQNDTSEKFQISQKLYGREEEIETLMTCFDQVSGGKAELILVSGYSGVGKSSLVEEIHKPVVRQRGYFISGKFDQFKRNVPFSSLIQAFQELIRQLLTENEDKVLEWKNSLLDALGGMGQVIIDVIPEVELIIGEQPRVLELDGTDAQNRFRDVFENFLSVFTTAEHPLVLFLDDLQWADQASLKFISMLMTRKKGRYLLIVGAYRDNEVNPSHPLMITLEEVRKEKPFSTILLKPLDDTGTNQLIADSLYASSEHTAPLAELLQQKTHGNPFFINQFLTSLYEDGLLDFDFQARKWAWDTSRIKGMTFADNVLELMASKIRKLSETTQEFLKLASCLGSKFDLNTLAMISNSSHRNAAMGLWEAIQEGVIVPLDDAYRYYQESHDADDYAPDPGTVVYKMLHDRIHEAVYAQIPDAQKQEVHLRIGRILLENMSKAELEEHIFDLVNHLNMAADLLESREEKDELARLNLVAGKKAMASTAHFVALGYLTRGISLMADDAWDVHYAAMFQLHRERTECEFLCGNMDKAEEIFAITLEHAKTKMDMGNIYELMMGVYLTTGKWPQGMKLGQECLQRFDIELPDDPERLQAALDGEYQKIETNLAGREIASIADAPDMSDEELAFCLALLHRTWTCAYMVNYDLGTLAALKIVTLSLMHGNADFSAFGYIIYASILSSVKGDYDAAYEFGKLALKLDEKFNNIALIPKVNNMFAHTVTHYKTDLRVNTPIYQESYQAALQCGDLWWGVWAVDFMVICKFIRGDHLTDVYETSIMYQDYVEKSGDVPLTQMLLLDQHIVLCLQGKTESRTTMDDAIYDEPQMVELLEGIPFDFGLFWYYIYKSFLLFLYGEKAQALEISMKADEKKVFAPGFMLVTEHHFYNSLIISANYDGASEEERERYLEILKQNLEKMKVWAENAPENYEHKHLLMSAEFARISGDEWKALDLYDQAIASARRYEYVQNEALANELAGRFYLSEKKEKPARGYLMEAHYLWLRWGATAKADALEAEGYSSLVARPVEDRHPDEDSSTKTTIFYSGSSSTTNTGSSDVLDMATVMKSSQAISGEIVLGVLLEKMMRIMIENAGAERGVLILKDGDIFRIEAEGLMDTDQVTVLQAIPMKEYEALPASMINYVIRKKESVILKTAAGDHLFSEDVYFREKDKKSVLCNPIVHQGKEIGVLYLENNLAVGAFTPRRVELLQLLSSQAAISLENAKLYQDLNEYNLTLEDKVEERTRELNQTLGKVEAANKKITASIEYAKRIQGSLLPNIREVQSWLPNSFFIWMPRDIVGGDIFHVESFEEGFVIAVIDCTGHGVPGAFMTMIAASFTRRIISHFNCHDPADILKQLNGVIKVSLQQDREDALSDDGLDASVCFVNPQEKTLTFAGAKLPLIYVQDGETKIIKGDRQSIGYKKADLSFEFTNHTIPIKKGMAFYMYTDGFIDQLGGEKNKSFGPKRFRELMKGNAHLPFETQQEKLLEVFDGYKGENKIQDDVTVIGFAL